MWSSRMQRFSRVMGGASRRFSTRAFNSTEVTSRHVRWSAVAVVAAATASAAMYQTNTTVNCQPQTGASAAPAAASSSTVGAEPITYYQQTASNLAKLPQTAEEIAKYSHKQLADLYDPSTPDSVLHPLAHGLVWGAPRPDDSLEALPLIWTSKDEDPFHRHMELLVRSLQNRICNNLLDVEKMPAVTLDSIEGLELNEKTRRMLLNQTVEPGQFRETLVIRPGSTGGGIERVLNGGRVFSKAGVNVSISKVKAPPHFYDRMLPDHPSLAAVPRPNEPLDLWTASISLVLHGVSPHVPTVHANWRFFDLKMADGKNVWWFGGGSDLTPTYVVDEDAVHFHSTARDVLDKYDATYYPEWKSWCDRYFTIKHRQETRGVGGVFFEDQHSGTKEHREKVMRSLGEMFSAQYFPVVLKRKDQKFNEDELAFQQLRRGRYVEFNLVYDKGTSYGLAMPNARVDAILMSLPAISRFTYKQTFDTDREKYTKDVLSHPRDWLATRKN